MEIAIVPAWVEQPATVRDHLSSIRSSDDVTVTDTPETATVVITEGVDGLSRAIEANISTPILPLGDPTADIDTIPLTDLASTIQAVRNGTIDRIERHVLAATIGAQEPVVGVGDLRVLTAEPASISEFAVSTNRQSLARYRADGFVFATPMGSGGYARAAGGPRIDPGVGCLAVVPVSPFRTAPDCWVVGRDGCTIEVLRDERPVVLRPDGGEPIDVPVETPITIQLTGSYETVHVPRSDSTGD